MAKINIKGPIISDGHAWMYKYFKMPATSPGDVEAALAKAGGAPVEVEISSPGGSVVAGSEIYTALKSYAGRVTVRIVGIAASAASVIAMAGDHVQMSPTAQMMVHNAWTYTEGDYREMEHSANVLKSTDETIASAYQIKSGKTLETLLGLMDAETWLTPAKAKELGLIDEILFIDPAKLVASMGSGLLPPEVIRAMQNQRLEAKLNYLKLKGAMKND